MLCWTLALLFCADHCIIVDVFSCVVLFNAVCNLLWTGSAICGTVVWTLALLCFSVQCNVDGQSHLWHQPFIACRQIFLLVKLSPLVINIVIIMIIMHALLVVVLLELKHVTQYWWIYVRKELLTALIIIKSSPCSSSCSHETLNKANNHIHDHVADKKPGSNR